MKVVGVRFPVKGTRIAVDHRYQLYGAVTRIPADPRSDTGADRFLMGNLRKDLPSGLTFLNG